MDSEGLIILTNDGDLTHRLTHPSFGVPEGVPGPGRGTSPRPARSAACGAGIDLDDGPTAPARVAVVAPNLLRIVIHEGRNRQVRRMCDAVGHPVLRLVRTRIGPIADPSLGPGESRPLSFDEVRSLTAAATPMDPVARSDESGPAGAGE